MAGSLWFCVKGYSRLQTVVALSSAEAELFAIAEAAKEIAGLGQLASHIWGELTKPLAIYTDSASARQIAGMEGFLRRMRHVDIRLCFIHSGSSLSAQALCAQEGAVVAKTVGSAFNLSGALDQFRGPLEPELLLALLA